jgi:hypothetical protein
MIINICNAYNDVCFLTSAYDAICHSRGDDHNLAYHVALFMLFSCLSYYDERLSNEVLYKYCTVRCVVPTILSCDYGTAQGTEPSTPLLSSCPCCPTHSTIPLHLTQEELPGCRYEKKIN